MKHQSNGEKHDGTFSQLRRNQPTADGSEQAATPQQGISTIKKAGDESRLPQIPPLPAYYLVKMIIRDVITKNRKGRGLSLSNIEISAIVAQVRGGHTHYDDTQREKQVIKAHVAIIEQRERIKPLKGSKPL